MKKCLGIITARGGSKGIPGKNMKLLNGKPLLQYTLEFCDSCEHLDKTVLTTDSQEMASFARQLGVEAPFLRPPELSGDLSKQEDAILHAMSFYESENYDYLAIMTPTNPFRRLDTFSRVYNELVNSDDILAMMSVVMCEHSPIFSNTLGSDGMMCGWVEDKYKWANRQELPEYYRITGSVVISEWDAFKEYMTILHNKTKAYVVDAVEAMDIDTPLDFLICDILARNGISHEKDLGILNKKEN